MGHDLMAAGIISDDDERRRLEIQSLLDEASGLADELVVEQRAQDDRRARRLVIFRRLDDLGVSRRKIARAAKVTPMVVTLALRPPPDSD